MNHRPGIDESWMPKSVPLRAMTVTSEESGSPSAASSMHLPIGIERFRKKWSLPFTNSRTRAAFSRSSVARTTAGRQLAEEERRAGAVPVVPLVAHLERLGDQVLQVDRPAEREGRGQDRGQLVAHQVEAARTSSAKAP